MKRRLLLANLALLAVAVGVARHLRQEWLETRAREQAVLLQRIRAALIPPPPPLHPAEPLKPAGYIDIAQKMLLSKDRNPTVIVEPPPAPPPKPMPPLPVFHGLLDVGDGPTAILSEKPGAPHHDFRPGEQVGEFKLVAVNREEITLEWDGQMITKKVDDILDRSVAPTSAGPAAAPAAAAQPRAAEPPPFAPAAPGTDLGAHGIKACQAGDDSPAGTVTGGYQKVVKESPFGKTCLWEPVR